MINTRRILAVTSPSVLGLGIAACSPQGAQHQSGSTVSSASPNASASQNDVPSQSGAGPQSGVPDEGNQAPDVNVADNDQRCDLTNLQPSIDSQQEVGSTTYMDIGFVNEGLSCWIDGFPQIIFSGGGSAISTAVRDDGDPGNIYTIVQGGRVGVTPATGSTDGVEGCNPADSELVDTISETGTGAASLQLTLRVCQEMPSVSVSPFESRS